MADPLTIVGGVVGILSSLTSLSTKLNDFRQDVQGAKSEIRDLAHEAEDLSVVLGHLKVAKEQGMIAYSLEKDLGSVLQRLSQTVSETEAFLQRCRDKRRTVGMYWAFTGKSQCLQLCRRLESYKSTISITLTLSSVLQGNEIHGQADRVLNSIGHIRRQLSDTRDYVLERYLMEMETVYEGSTVADVRSVSDVKAVTRTPSLENIDEVVQLSVPDTLLPLSTPPSPPAKPRPSSKHVSGSESPKVQAAIVPAPSREKPRPASQIFKSFVQKFTEQSGKAKHPDKSENKGIAEHWKQSTVEATHLHQFRYPNVRWSYNMVLTSRNGRFAAYTQCLDESYGILIRGPINKHEACINKLLHASTFDPPAAAGRTDFKHRNVLDLVFQNDGALIAAFYCWDDMAKRSYLRLFQWDSITAAAAKAISPTLMCTVGAGSHVAMSPDCRRLAVCESHDVVAVRDITNNATTVWTISGDCVHFCHDLVWSKDCKQLLVTHKSRSDYKIPAVSVFDAANGSCIGSCDFDTLSLPRINWLEARCFPLAGGKEVAIIHWFGTSNPDDFTVEETSKPVSEMTKLRHFIAHLDLENRRATPIRVERDRIEALNRAQFSPDGSCAIVQPWRSPGQSEEAGRSGSSNGPLSLYDTLSGEPVVTIPYEYFTAHSCFDHDGRMVMVARNTHNGVELSFWEASTQA